jgi:hypothetical protein
LKKLFRLDVRFDMRLSVEGGSFPEVSISSIEKATELLCCELLSVVALLSSVILKSWVAELVCGAI